MEKLRKIIKKISRLKPQKMHLDYLAGVLSIPLLISAIVINWSNLSKTPASPAKTPAQQIIVVPQNTTASHPADSPLCQKSIGPISITSPQEGETITQNPVCITISYPNTNYCSVVWSYSINNGAWSDYNSNSPCLYNVPNGTVTFALRVSSVASTDTTTLTRSFIYAGSTTPTAGPATIFPVTPTPVASGSAK